MAFLYLNLHSKGFTAYRAHTHSILYLLFTVTLRHCYSHFIHGKLETQCNSQSHCSQKWGGAVPDRHLLVLSFPITEVSSLYILIPKKSKKPSRISAWGTRRGLEMLGRKKSKTKKSQNEKYRQFVICKRVTFVNFDIKNNYMQISIDNLIKIPQHWSPSSSKLFKDISMCLNFLHWHH